MNTSNVWNNKFLNLLMNGIIFVFVATGICHSVIISLLLPISIYQTALFVAFIYIALTFIFYSRKTFFIGAGIFTLWLISAILINLANIKNFAVWLGNFLDWAFRYITGYVDFYYIYAKHLHLFVWIAVSVLVYIVYRISPNKLIYLSVILFGIEWLLGHNGIALSVLISFIGLVAVYCMSGLKAAAKRKGQSTSDLIPKPLLQLFALLLVLPAMFAAVFMLPQGGNPQNRLLNAGLTRLYEISDRFIKGMDFSAKQFSIRESGFQPLENRLGGPVQPKEGKVMIAMMDTPVALRGSISNTYSGNMWMNTLSKNRYDIKSSQNTYKMQNTFDLNRPAYIPKETMDLFQREDITIWIEPQETLNATFFIGGKLNNFSMNYGSKTKAYFDIAGNVFATHKIERLDNYILTSSVLRRGYDGFDEAFKFILKRKEGAFDSNRDFVDKNYLQLPETLPDRVKQKAQEITEGIENSYDKAVALESYLRENFTYTLAPDEPPVERDFVDYFLETKEGYCTYFASALAVMARCVGLPSRYVEGYRPGSFDPVGLSYTMEHKDAHAWVEIYFNSIGWIPFDATPGRSVVHDMGEEQFEIEEPVSRDTSSTEIPSFPPVSKSPNSASAESSQDVGYGPGGIFGLWHFIAIIAGMLAVAGWVIFLKRTKERYTFERLSRKKPEFDDQLCALFHDMKKMLELLCIPAKVGETLYSFAARVDEQLPHMQGRFSKFADVLVLARFAGILPDMQQLESAYALHSELERYLREKIGFWRYFVKRVLGFKRKG